LVDGRLEPVGHQVGVEDVVTFFVKSLPGIFQGQFILAVGAVISLQNNDGLLFRTPEDIEECRPDNIRLFRKRKLVKLVKVI